MANEKLTVKKICENVNNLIKYARAPMATIPSAILVSSAINRPGLSPMLTTANIIRRAQEAGIIPGWTADGGQCVNEAMERIRVEEIFKAIKLDGKVQISIPAGAIQFTGTGANAGGPMVITGFNINAPHGFGIFG